MEAVRDEYDRIAAEYDRRWRPYLDATLAGVLDAVTLAGDETILDVPCGTGELVQRLLARWPRLRITGADLSPGMLARAKAKNSGQSVHWVEADVASLPFSDKQFDWVTCANSFHYFRKPGAALRELQRILAPGGTLVLVDWCDDYLACKLCSRWLRWRDPAFFRTYSLAACRALLSEKQLEVVSYERFRISWLWGLMRFVCRRI